MGCSLSKQISNEKGKDDEDNDEKELSLKNGVSVYYLEHVLLQEVKDKDSSDLDINTAIRRKGTDVICPRDNQLGAAYVDCIHGKDFVGQANVMLSYSWDYSIPEVVMTLVAKCKGDNRDPKRTYLWIDCLCNNLHRFEENSSVSFDEFRDNFFNTVTGAGTVWSLISIWDNPNYLQRAWCVFETYVAITEEGVTSEIIMLEKGEKQMIESIDDIDTLFNVMSSTRIEDAEASQPEDKQHILTIVEDNIGCDELNITLNMLFLKWISGILLSEVEEGRELDETSSDSTQTLNIIAPEFKKTNLPDIALKLYQEILAIEEKELGKEHPDTANTYNNIGLVMKEKGDYDGALKMYHKCLAIEEKSLGEEHPDTANTYSNIGLVMMKKGDLKGALDIYQKCLAAQETSLVAKENPGTATTYSNIGGLMLSKGDYDGALENFQKCLAINEKSLGKEHPDTANTYNNIGLAMWKKDDFDGALDMYQKCLAIQEESLGEDNPDTAITYNNIGTVMWNKGDLKGALGMFSQCLAINEKFLGKNHPETESVRENMNIVLNSSTG